MLIRKTALAESTMMAPAGMRGTRAADRDTDPCTERTQSRSGPHHRHQSIGPVSSGSGRNDQHGENQDQTHGPETNYRHRRPKSQERDVENKNRPTLTSRIVLIEAKKTKLLVQEHACKKNDDCGNAYAYRFRANHRRRLPEDDRIESRLISTGQILNDTQKSYAETEGGTHDYGHRGIIFEQGRPPNEQDETRRDQAGTTSAPSAIPETTVHSHQGEA